VALFAGWPSLPPEGHVGAALRRAWDEARIRDPGRTEPLAYAVAGGAPEALRRECLSGCGLSVISYDVDGAGLHEHDPGLLACLRALQRAVTEPPDQAQV